MSNSSYVTQKLFAKIAPEYALHYKTIKGNLYAGITLEEVRFKDALLAKKITLNYNPNALLYKELQVTRLQIEDANVDAIKHFIASFQTGTKREEETISQETPRIGLTIKAHDIALSTLPFIEHGIHISKAHLKAKSLSFDLEDYRVETEGFESDIQSDLGKIIVSGDLKNRVLKLQYLSLVEVDTETIQKLINQEDTKAKSKDSTKDNFEMLSLPFDEMRIGQTKATLKPTHYKGIAVNHMVLDAKHLDILLKAPVLAKSGSLSLDLSSDMAEGTYRGRVANNVLTGKVILKPKNALYKRYALGLRPGAIQKITADINASSKQVTAIVMTRAIQLLQTQKGDFNLDVDQLHSRVVYDLPSSLLSAKSEALVDTPYAKAIHINNALQYDGNLTYNGDIVSQKLEQMDPKLRMLFEALHLHYKGNEKSLNIALESQYFKGTFNSDDLVRGVLHIENIKGLRLASFVSPPPELNSTEIRHIKIDTPVNFKSPIQLTPHIVFDSNLLHAELNGRYRKGMKLQGVVSIPKDALFRKYQPRIKWENLTPLKINASLDKEKDVLKIVGKVLKLDINYRGNQRLLKAEADINGLKVTAKGKPEEKVTIHAKIPSLKILDHMIRGIYRLDAPLPPIEGSISLDGSLEQMKDLQLTLKAPQIVYIPKRGKKQHIDDIALQIHFKDSTLTVPAYHLTYNNQKFFATKPSKLLFHDTKVILPAFWLNNTLKISGEHDLKKSEGTFTAKSDRFHIQDSVADLYAKINIETVLKGLDTTVKGKIILLGGKVSPDIQGKSFVTDSDIIIMQEMKKQKSNSFMEHLNLMLKLDAKKPIIYKQPDTYVRLKPDLTILKEPKGKLLYLGSVTLLEGGYYRFKDKKFVLKKSYVYFTGDVNKPLLDIKATYRSLKYLITVTVTGTPAAPNINFSSSPSLTREQILSLLLFGTETGGDTHSGDEMMRMMGGAMAKAALSDLGVKIDHLVLGKNGSVEVGKKLNNKITVIYINGDIPVVKLIYKHSDTTESVFGVSEQSQSYDIIYKKDVKNLKDTFKRDGF